MEKKVNLEEILKSYLTVESMRLNNPDYTFNMVVSAMKEACRQTLGLAAESATGRSIVTVIEPCGTDDYVGLRKRLNISYVVDKESILNTINQVQ